MLAVVLPMKAVAVVLEAVEHPLLEEVLQHLQALSIQAVAVEHGTVVALLLVMADQALLYLAIQLLIDLPLQLQDRPHLLYLAETTFTLLIRLERLLFKEQTWHILQK